MKKIHAFILTFLAVGLIASQISLFYLYPKERETAIIGRVIDGDTLELTDGRTVRLLNINTPEKGSAYSEEATNFLSYYTNKSVQIETSGIDKYDRTLAKIYAPEYLNLEIIRQGLATTFLVSDEETNEFVKAEKEAISQGIGMWVHSKHYGCVNAKVYPKEEKVTIYVLCNISLYGFYLRDESRKIYKIPDIKEKEVTLYSTSGNNTSSKLFWNAGNVWNDDRDSIYIFDSENKLVYYYSYGY
jgi:endonuclease YncB( thermonuclease family)